MTFKCAVKAVAMACVPDANYRLLDLIAGTVTSTSFRLDIGFDINRPARLCYYKQGDELNKQYTAGETSSSFGAPGNPHKQTASGLESGETYFVISQTSDDGGTQWRDVSCPTEFSTISGQNFLCSGFDTTLSMGGCMFGSNYHGWRINYPFKHLSSLAKLEYIAEDDSNVVRISRHNRLGAGYHDGDGGNVHIAIYPDLNGEPDYTNMLGQTDPNIDYIPDSAAYRTKNRLWIPLIGAGAAQVPGVKYWQVWDARSDQGHGRAAFNSSQCTGYLETVAGITDRGPYPGPEHMSLWVRANANDPWQNHRPGLIPLICWETASGRIRGNIEVPLYGQNLDDGNLAASRTIEGGQVARQTFTMDRNVSVDGLWLYFGHSWKKSADGSPLTLNIRQNNGTLIATGSYASNPTLSATCVAGEQEDDIVKRQTRTWGYTDLSSQVNFLNGQTYRAELSSGANGAFAMSAFHTWRDQSNDGGVYEFTQQWKNSNAIIVAEGRWTPDTPYNEGDRELPMRFTIVGKAKRFY